MYNALDLYLVTARYEGGPQSIVECGLTKTPITGLCLGIELFGPSAWACYLIVTCLVMYLSGNTGLYKSQKVANWIPKTPYQ